MPIPIPMTFVSQKFQVIEALLTQLMLPISLYNSSVSSQNVVSRDFKLFELQIYTTLICG